MGFIFVLKTKQEGFIPLHGDKELLKGSDSMFYL